MRTEALLGPVPPSPSRGGEDESTRTASAVRRIRPTSRSAWRPMRRISWTRGTLRRLSGLFETTLGRPPRRVHGVYAGLSNTR